MAYCVVYRPEDWSELEMKCHKHCWAWPTSWAALQLSARRQSVLTAMNTTPTAKQPRFLIRGQGGRKPLPSVKLGERVYYIGRKLTTPAKCLVISTCPTPSPATSP